MPPPKPAYNRYPPVKHHRKGGAWKLPVFIAIQLYLLWYLFIRNPSNNTTTTSKQQQKTTTDVSSKNNDPKPTSTTAQTKPRITSYVDAKGFETFDDMEYTRPMYTPSIMRFQNVQVTENQITVYYDDSNSDFQPPKEENEVNIFLWSTKKPMLLPTRLFEDSSNRIKNLRVKYVAASTQQPTCSKWYEQPALLMHVSWPTNYFHEVREAILSSFQTLRELGLLQLIRIDEQGNIKEVKDGKGDQYCIDIDLHTGENLIKPSTCWNYPDSPVLPSQCTVNTDPWCRAGVHTLQSILPLISSKQQQDGPILLPILGNDVKKELYDIMYAITPGFLPGGLPSLDGGGVCFKELFLGHSATLDAYHPYYIPHRKVSRHIVSEWLASRDTSQAGNWWQKYEELGLKELRQGVNSSYLPRLYSAMTAACGKNNNDSISSLISDTSPAAQDYQRLKKEWIRTAEGWYQQRASNLSTTTTSSELEKLPVVTFMSRRKTCNPEAMSRDIFNPEDILEYILRWYDVTLKVTTFQEPLPEVVKLLQSTDVLLGMHGAGWTNTLFVKDAATVLQFMPYGWKIPGLEEDETTRHGSGIRGHEYAVISELISNCKYVGWHSPHASHAFFSQIHFFGPTAKNDTPYILHPTKDTPVAGHALAPSYWIDQNTYVDIKHMAHHIDLAMEKAGISRRKEYVPGDIGGTSYWESVGLKAD